MWRALRALFSGAAADDQSDRRIWVRRPCDLTAFYQQSSSVSGGRQLARVRNISRGGMHVIVKQQFEAGAQLSVELPGGEGQPAFSVLACVVHSAPQAEGEWALGCSFAQELSDEDLRPFGARRSRTAPSDQRAWQRFPCAAEARFGLVRAPDAGRREATVVNISANGVGLVVNVAIDVGTLLDLHLHRAGRHDHLKILACVVRVTPQQKGEWLLGCNFISELNDKQLAGLL